MPTSIEPAPEGDVRMDSVTFDLTPKHPAEINHFLHHDLIPQRRTICENLQPNALYNIAVRLDSPVEVNHGSCWLLRREHE